MYNAILDCGVIKRSVGLIDREEWDKLVKSHPGLEQVPDRFGTSPSRKKKYCFLATV